MLFKWDPSAKYLATVGQKRLVNIFLRNGELAKQFSAGHVLALDWDKDGETLAVLQKNSSIIQLYNMNEDMVKDLETNMKELTFLSWSRVGPQLAIGTAKGNLMLYNKQKNKKIPIQGKHSKAIIAGAWSKQNQLCLASVDKTMTISDKNGNTLDQCNLPNSREATAMEWSTLKRDEDGVAAAEDTIAMNMAGTTLMLYHALEPEVDPVELEFQLKYGQLIDFNWYGDGYIMLAFSNGYVVSISTHAKEIGMENHMIKLGDGASLINVACAPKPMKIASAGTDGVHVVDMTDWKESKGDFRDFSHEEGQAEQVAWSNDGQILSVATNMGNIFNFLMMIPTLASHCGTRLVYLSSLLNVSIMETDPTKNTPPINIEVAVEPSFVAFGQNHVAIGMNNHCWIYNATPENSQLCREKEYIGTVNHMVINDTYCAVLSDGRCHLHPINPGNNDREDIVLPEDSQRNKDSGGAINTVAMTPDFLVYGTERGTVHHFYLKDWAQVNEYRHEQSIVKVYPNASGTRVVVQDSLGRAFLYSPVDDEKVDVERFPSSADRALWDPAEPNVFCAVDSKSTRSIHTYVYLPQSTKGPKVNWVGKTKIPAGFNSILLHDGTMYGQKDSGEITTVRLSTHMDINQKGRQNTEKLKSSLNQLIALSKLKDAWDIALQLKDKSLFGKLSYACMEVMDIELAIRVNRELKDTAMVLALQELKYIEDKHLLAGHVCMLEGDYQRAQNLFLASTKPVTALQMRRDLLNWDFALKLARSLAPEQIPQICREYGSSLEVKGEYSQALEMYERSVREIGAADNVDHEHIRVASAGIARMTLRLGNLQKGKNLALESDDKHLMRDCGLILESMNQYSDAAELYFRAECYEKAAAIYILTKNFQKAAPLMEKITTPKLHAQYAKAKEAEKQYEQAAVSYQRAKDMDSVARINLHYLNNPTKAFAIVRETKSSEGASMVATFCIDNRDFPSAIQFLLMAKRNVEAFQLAQGHKKMKEYADALGENGNQDEYLNIANYYEGQQDMGNAGKFYAICNHYSKAMKLFLKCGTERISDAIDVIKQAEGAPGSELLVRELHDFLIGEKDGKVKDPTYIFQLYMAIGEYSQAAGTAILIANQEQKIGNYQIAHSNLFDTHQHLVKQKIPVPNELVKNLILLHSYMLVRTMRTNKQHHDAARLLIRVSKSISRFPTHIVQILTNTVIECHRAGLKRSGFEWASVLMRAEYRGDVDKRYRRKIETIVRKGQNEEEPAETQTPCPFCGFTLPNTMLDCPSCTNNIPYCITTGRHMLVDEWTNCPECKFPTLYDPFVKLLKDGGCCPMCKKTPKLSSFVKLSPKEATAILTKKDEEEEEEEKTVVEGDEDGNIDLKDENVAPSPKPPTRAKVKEGW